METIDSNMSLGAILIQTTTEGMPLKLSVWEPVKGQRAESPQAPTDGVLNQDVQTLRTSPP